MNIAFLASHNGTSARAITTACTDGRLKAQAKLLISNNTSAAALAWAQEAGLSAFLVNTGNSRDPDATTADLLRQHNIDWVICSGYMKRIGEKTITAVSGRILNVHPALLPRYGGQGMYGRFVHDAVYQNKDTETGITIHLVDEEYDHGTIVAQKKIPVAPGMDAAGIEAMVKAAEPDFYIETLLKILTSSEKIS